jgi:hypothetical protein
MLGNVIKALAEKSNNPKSKILVPWVTGWQWLIGSGMAGTAVAVAIWGFLNRGNRSIIERATVGFIIF